MFTEKNSNYFINLCRQYSDATLIPTTLRDNSVVLFSYQGEQMGLPHSQEPDAYIYNPYPNGPEFCEKIRIFYMPRFLLKAQPSKYILVRYFPSE